MNPLISTAGPDDAAELAEFINNAYRGDSSRKGWTTEADLLDGTRTDAELVGRTLTSDHSTMLVYRENGIILGCVELRHEADRMYLGTLTVDPEKQGQGLGKKLMAAAEAFALDAGIQIMYMTVLTQRTELIDWYVRHGYTNTGKTKPFAFDDPRFGLPKEPLEFVILTKKI